MATGPAVAVYRKHSKKDFFSNKNQEIVSSQEGIECRGREQMENILSLCQDASPERVYEIDLHASKVTKIENFERFTKLRCLDLSCNQIKIIKALKKNVELKELKLYSNKLTKIEGLENLRELCSLQLQDNSIEKVGEGLQNLKKLKDLRVDGNAILTISVSEIASCSKLTYLNVSSNKLTDISFINCLPNLEEFYASHNELVKIPDLGRCKKLQELDLSYNKVSSMAGIKSLPVITILRLEHNIVKDLDGSGAITALEELYVGNNQLRSIKKLSLQFPAIQVLNISSNMLNSLDLLCKELSQCDMLSELNIVNNPCYSPVSLEHQNSINALPRLDVLNGNPVKRPQSFHGKTRPPMRPVSVSQMVSTKHLEEQVLAVVEEQNSFESMISSKFDVVYDLLKKLPEKTREKSGESKETSKSPNGVRGSKIDVYTNTLTALPVCCSNTKHPSSEPQISVSRNRSLHRDQSAECIDKSSATDTQKSEKTESTSSLQGTQVSQLSLNSPRPSSRCSNRARIQDAITFAEQHFDM